MIKNFTKLESEVEGKISQFYIEIDTPIKVVREMLEQFMAFVADVEAKRMEESNRTE